MRHAILIILTVNLQNGLKYSSVKLKFEIHTKKLESNIVKQELHY
jgi:hypothetical protein